MSAVNDAVVIGTVLGLIFAAVSYYLYSRLGQLERKVGLMENILLDLKVQTEQTLMATFDTAAVTTPPQAIQAITPFQDEEEVVEEIHGSQSTALPEILESREYVSPDDAEVRTVQVAPSRGSTAPSPVAVQVTRGGPVPATASSAALDNYPSMTYKQLLGIAKQKNVTGGSHMTKNQLIDALRQKDSGSQEFQTTPLTQFTSSESVEEIGSAQENHFDGSHLEEVDVDASLVN